MKVPTDPVPSMRPPGFRFGLDAWIIQDGNYGDFTARSSTSFAVEFSTEADPVPAPGSPGLSWKTQDLYDGIGRVAAAGPEWWVLDFGEVSAYRNQRPPRGTNVGDTVRSVWRLGVDPFFYFESLAAIDAVPPLIYTWQLGRIWLAQAPWVERSDRVRVRDEAQLRFFEVPETKAWTDDSGHAWYLLDCTLSGGPRKRL